MTRNSLLARALCTVIGLHGGSPLALFRVGSTFGCLGRNTICLRLKIGGAFPRRRIMLIMRCSRARIADGAAIHNSCATPPYPGATRLCRCLSTSACIAAS
ncbi:hypothetical protein PR003_g33318 [Phytophthora rubi]|uniref:Uncharacterized protein n=1 Tax=Phytophthora rubi TaxID=129364 RepID=A0A6A3G7C4_9STRA|nr:hypothetical protein PR002_g32099 [Phytophthora rubi]KAE8955375.1 hypothetical protein PR001_g32133 [Phytophthora rubi]KAE9263003.1 hypothetical protein PR003_g33318 [Phytophthora rubi]